MKVVILSYLVHPDRWGGAPRSAHLLAGGLRDAGAHVSVITTHRGPYEEVEEDGIRIHRIPPGNLYWVAEKDRKGVVAKVGWQLVDLWNPIIRRRVERILRAERPDVVHVNKMRGLSPSVWGAARRAGAGVLLQTCRDYELMSPEGTMTTRLGRMAARDALPVRPYRVLRARMSRVVQGATAPSRYTLKTLTGAGFFPRALTTVIPNSHGFSRAGIPGRASPAQEVSDRPVRILYLGRVEEIKGVGDLCDAFARLPEAGIGAVLDVAGDGGAREGLRRRYGDHPGIVFHGAVRGRGKEDLLRGAHVVVMPSRCPESFGNVIAEAFAHGKPVIGTMEGAIPELIEPGVTGARVPTADAAALADALADFIRNPRLAPSMRSACLKAAERFSLDAVVDGYARFYEAVIEASSGKSAGAGVR